MSKPHCNVSVWLHLRRSSPLVKDECRFMEKGWAEGRGCGWPADRPAGQLAPALCQRQGLGQRGADSEAHFALQTIALGFLLIRTQPIQPPTDPAPSTVVIINICIMNRITTNMIVRPHLPPRISIITQY
eukprot:12426271-Heterocapsa_arctica.AAC.1